MRRTLATHGGAAAARGRFEVTTMDLFKIAGGYAQRGGEFHGNSTSPLTGVSAGSLRSVPRRSPRLAATGGYERRSPIFSRCRSLPEWFPETRSHRIAHNELTVHSPRAEVRGTAANVIQEGTASVLLKTVSTSGRSMRFPVHLVSIISVSQRPGF